MMPPSGRAANPTPRVANDGQRAGERVGAREERGAEVQRGGGAEPDEVVGLDDGADTGADGDPLGVLGAVHRAPHRQSVVAHELILSNQSRDGRSTSHC